MSRRWVSQGSAFEEKVGYSRAVVDGRWVFVSGTTGFDYTTMTISGDVVDQTRQAVANIDAALTEAGATVADVVRVRYFLADIADFERCVPVIREYFAGSRPAATMIQAALIDPRIKIEIEVTARRRRG